MLNNSQTHYVQRGESIDYKNTGEVDLKANDVVSLETRIGIAGCDIPIGVTGSVNVIGVFDIPAVASEIFTVGKAVYWNGEAITATAADNTPAGWVVEPKPSTKSLARVKIG